MDGETVATIGKNSKEDILVRRTEFQGIELLDVRVFGKPSEPGRDGVPTKKGLMLRPDTWREVVNAVARELGEADGKRGEGASSGATLAQDEREAGAEA